MESSYRAVIGVSFLSNQYTSGAKKVAEPVKYQVRRSLVSPVTVCRSWENVSFCQIRAGSGIYHEFFESLKKGICGMDTLADSGEHQGKQRAGACCDSLKQGGTSVYNLPARTGGDFLTRYRGGLLDHT